MLMSDPTPELKLARETIVAEIRRLMVNRSIPLLVALDGGSGSGKSTLALLIAAEVEAAVVAGDDFFAAEISDAGWDARTPQARAADAIDWRRLRAEALNPSLLENPRSGMRLISKRVCVLTVRTRCARSSLRVNLLVSSCLMARTRRGPNSPT